MDATENRRLAADAITAHLSRPVEVVDGDAVIALPQDLVAPLLAAVRLLKATPRILRKIASVARHLALVPTWRELRDVADALDAIAAQMTGPAARA